MLTQKLEQKLLQKLSPQQIQLMKLLQVPAMALEERIKQEIETNPALEEGEEDSENEMSVEDDYDTDIEETDEFGDRTEDSDEIQELRKDENEEFSFDDYIEEEEYIPAYKTMGETGGDEEKKDIPFSSGISFQDFLIQQLGTQILDDHKYQLGLHIIGNIDEAGYLQREPEAMVNDLAFSQGISTTQAEIIEVLTIIQQFDPPGIGARTLQECLLLQLKRIEEDRPSVKHAILIVEKFFDEYTKRHYDKIEQRGGITEEELKEADAEIKKLNPKPGNSLDESLRSNPYIIPDFIIFTNNDELILNLNSRNTPELRLNKTYLDMIDSLNKNNKQNKSKEKDKEAMLFVKQKLESAKWFIEALRQREHTLYNTMYAIMNYQREFFLTGDETKLKPMILKDVADLVKLDISTISRVASSKYVQTPYGVFLLKYFFSEGMQTESGEEVSSREVKKILKDCIDSEDKKKPYNDDVLAKMLKEKGYNIARRTVTKYREQLNIPVARLRKQI